MIDKIEDMLGELLDLIGEEEYVNFLQDNEIMTVYDVVMNLSNYEDVLTDSFLKKVYDLVLEKLNSSK